MRFLTALTILSGLAGAVCLTLAARSPAFVDPNGILVEPFGLMATGNILLLVTALAGVSIGALWILRRARG